MMDTSPLNIQHHHVLHRKLAAIRHLQMLVNVLSGLAAVLATAVLFVAFEMALDWWLELPWAARLLALLVTVGASGYLAVRRLIQPLLSPPDDDTLALRMEHVAHDLRSRLISAIQFARQERVSSPQLVQHLISETETLSATLPFRKAVQWKTLLRIVTASALICVSFSVALQRTRPASLDLLRRALLFSVPVPRKTTVICVTRDRVVAKGDSVVIEATAKGVVPPDGRMTLKYGNGQPQTLTLLPVREDRARFRRAIENIQETFSYKVKLNDGVSETFRIEARPRPTLSSLCCVQVYPAYTGLPSTRRALGDLALLAGSQLQLQGVPAKPLQRATIRLAGLNQQMPMQLAKEWTGVIPIPAKGLTGFSIGLVDTDGLISKDETVYRVDIVPDKPPSVNLTYPLLREELVTVYGTLWVAFEAADEYGIGSIFLHYKQDQASEEKVIELDLEGQHPKTLRRRYEWKMSAVSPLLVEGTAIEFWVEVRDTNDVTGPGVTSTEHHFIKVVSEVEKRAELMNRLDEYLSQLGTAADAQQKLNQSLGELIRQKPSR